MDNNQSNSPSGADQLGQFYCPVCNQLAEQNKTIPVKIFVDGTTTYPMICQSCGHQWEIQSKATGDLLKLNISENAYPSAPLILIKNETVSPATSIQTPDNTLQLTQPRILIPLLIIFAVLIGIIIHQGIQLEEQKNFDKVNTERELAKLSIGYTATTETRATFTAEARATIGAGETSTTQAIATATAQSVSQNGTATTEARIVAETSASQKEATNTDATAQAEETMVASTAQSQSNIATATAERQATVSAQAATIEAKSRISATSTAETRSTSTAEARAIIATTTAQKVATLAAQATLTAQASATAAAIAQMTPLINARIVVCATGFDSDINMFENKHEITEAWILLENVGTGYANNVKVTLFSNDEESKHPNKSETITHLPPGGQIPIKLTVDTTFSPNSYAKIVVTSDEGVGDDDFKESCKGLDENAIKMIGTLGEIGKLVITKPILR